MLNKNKLSKKVQTIRLILNVNHIKVMFFFNCMSKLEVLSRPVSINI